MMQNFNDMKTITLVKNNVGALEGLSDDDKKAYAKFIANAKDLEPGEIIEIAVKIPRNPKFHRKFFAMLQVGFDAWELNQAENVQKNFDSFRQDVLILAGFYEKIFDLDGNIKFKAQSISFAKMDDSAFDRVYNKVLDVLLDNVLKQYGSKDDVNKVVDKILSFA
jgi:hypothetical protein